MSASSPSGFQFVTCGSNATILSPSSATEPVTVPAGGTGVGIFYVSRITQTISGHIYDCSSGSQTTTEVPGGTLGASGPQSVATQGNPLGPVSVAAGSYTMSASSPSGYKFVTCGGNATITSPNSATEPVTVPAGGTGVGIFYVSRITQTCPSGQKLNLRWHYSAIGTSGSWSGTQSTICPGSVVMGPQSMEGDLKLSPGTVLNAGYDLTSPGNNTTFTVAFNNPAVVFTLRCVSGATPTQSTLTLSMPSTTYTISGSGWFPSGDQHSALVYQGSVVVPDVCQGGKVRFDKGGTFTTGIS
jgi:hypothetical protein